jgi:hypothetical protein
MEKIVELLKFLDDNISEYKEEFGEKYEEDFLGLVGFRSALQVYLNKKYKLGVRDDIDILRKISGIPSLSLDQFYQEK